MTQQSTAIMFSTFFGFIVHGLSAAAAAHTNDANMFPSDEQAEEQKMPVSTLCGIEEFAQRWKIFDYRDDQDAADLIALGR
jgi:hypothetical protein